MQWARDLPCVAILALRATARPSTEEARRCLVLAVKIRYGALLLLRLQTLSIVAPCQELQYPLFPWILDLVLLWMMPVSALRLTPFRLILWTFLLPLSLVAVILGLIRLLLCLFCLSQ